jgi:glucose-6-phosphate isomerase, archaeal
MKITESKTFFNINNGVLSGENIIESVRKLGDINGIFQDKEAFNKMDQNQIAYKVQMHNPEKEGKEGGLFFGTSFLYPGIVGDEYFMTKGHYHSKRDTAEYYWCLSGEGILLLMDETGKTNAIKIFPGSLNYIQGNIAHRLVNTGDEILVVGACWPSDAGHDYRTIAKHGFSVRIRSVEGKPEIIKNKR